MEAQLLPFWADLFCKAHREQWQQTEIVNQAAAKRAARWRGV